MPRNLPDTLIANTARLETADGELNGESRGVAPRRRRRRAPAGGKVSGRKFQIADAVFERVAQQAIRKRTNPSAIVNELLDRHLPHFKVEAFDRPPAAE